MSALAPTLQAFFTDRLVRQRQASPHTIAVYRDAWRLLLVFAGERTGKPPSSLDVADLEADLRGCLDFVGRVGEVKFWTRQAGDVSLFRYGFYREPWALQALDFMDQAEDLCDTDRAWMNGLLFGYSPQAIQEYITRHAEQHRPQAASG